MFKAPFRSWGDLNVSNDPVGVTSAYVSHLSVGLVTGNFEAIIGLVKVGIGDGRWEGEAVTSS